jgi:hypothetical protein
VSLNLQTIIDGVLLLFAALTFFGADKRIRKMQFAMSRREVVGGVAAALGLVYLVYLAGRLSTFPTAQAAIPTQSPSVSPTPAFPATNVMFSNEAYTFGFPPGFHPNASTHVNVQVINLGPQLARNVCYSTTLLPMSTPVLSAALDQMYGNFRSVPSTLCSDLEPGQGSFQTLVTPKLSARDVADLRTGRIELFLFGHLTYQDANGNHDVEFCSSLQVPEIPFTLHTCRGHNRVL